MIKSFTFLFVLIFSLLMIVYVVAYGQVATPGEASGICLIRNGRTSLPGFYDPDVGKGYAKVAKPGVNTFDGIRGACAKSDFDALHKVFCAQNPGDSGGDEVAGFDKAGRFLASGGCPACQYYQCPSKEKITYPVAELGNCNNQSECHAYCEKPENNRACFEFVKKHNLISKNELDKWEKFIDVAVNGGPGGCKNEKECINYCEDAAHIVECTDFVAKYDLASPQELAEMRKVAKALQSGAKLPGNCRNKTACVAYCEDSTHTEECALFLEKAGFITKKEANTIRKFEGRSPGDCAKGKDSFTEAQKSCNAFCNDPKNQPVCFRFLAEAGIMTTEEATQAGSLSDFQACIPFAPQEIQQCFITNLGPELFEAMKQGVLPLEEDIEEMITKIRAARACVNRYADQFLQTFTDDPEALACINSELGADYLQRASRGEVKCGDAAPAQKKIASCIEKKLMGNIDRCFSLACSEATTCIQNIQKRPGGTEGDVSINSEIVEKLTNKLSTCIAENIRACLAKDCGEAMACIERIQSEATGKERGEGKSDPSLEAEITAKFTSCGKDEQGGPSQPSGQSREPEQEATGYSQYEIPITPELCANFSGVPECSYAGSPDSQNYQLCKKCYPDR